MVSNNGSAEWAFWAETVDGVARRVESSVDGLSTVEAERRLQRLRREAPVRRREPWWRLLLSQFTSPIVLTLIVAGVISAFLRDVSDALIILGIVMVSGLLGFWQEKGAADAVARLLASVRVTSRAVRDSNSVEIPVDEVVPGDVVEVAAGSLIPGDGIVLGARDLSVDQAALTGETLPVAKTPGVLAADVSPADRDNVCYLGTHVVSGTGRLLVVRVGAATEFGKVSERLAEATPPTEFETGLRRLGGLLVRVTLILAVGIFIANVALSKPVLGSFLFSVALAVGLTPQLLPVIVSVNLSKGARRMAREHVIVKRLAAIEDFGSMTVLCSDKTGTLTEGRVAVSGAEDPTGEASSRVLELARINAHLESGFANPIDEALRSEPAPDGYTKIDEVPYDFQRKRLSVLVADHGGSQLITKGALDSVLGVCASVRIGGRVASLATMADRIETRRRALEDQGFRLLGVATRSHDGPSITAGDEADMTFEGVVALADPPKVDAQTSIDALRRVGVTVKMITGDSRRVAAHVATAVGLDGTRIYVGSDLAGINDDQLVDLVVDACVFAEVDPIQKERIIAAHRRAGAVVGHLGDGINDAPALHAANVGISVDTAVDVAKEAADFVLLEQDLAVLAAGIEAGRITFANTMKYVFAATSANFGNMFSMAGASLFLSYLPLLPKQVLMTNLLTDLPEMTIATDRVDPEAVAQPTRWDIGVIRRFMLWFGGLSSLFDYATFGVLLLGLGASQDEFRTGWFVESIVSAVLIVLVVRTRLPVTRSRPGWPLVVASLSVIAAVVAVPFLPFATTLGFTPLPFSFYAALAAVAAAYIAAAELLKRRFFGHGLDRPPPHEAAAPPAPPGRP